jgi:hypothetical protein
MLLPRQNAFLPVELFFDVGRSQKRASLKLQAKSNPTTKKGSASAKLAKADAILNNPQHMMMSMKT